MDDSRLLTQRTTTLVHAEAGHERDLLPIFLLRFDRANTRRAYLVDLVQFFGTESVSLELARAVRFVEVNAFVEQLQSEGLRPATIRRKLSAIRGFFDWLIALELVATNPADRQVVRRVDRNRHEEGAILVLTKEEARRLLAASAAPTEAGVRDHALILTLLHCTLRRSEAASMDVEHVQQRGPYRLLHLPRTKGGSSQYVKVPNHVAEPLDRMRDHYGLQSGPFWRSLSRNDSRGKRLSPSAIYEVVRRAARRAGLSERVGAHTLRHTGCTLAIEAGATPQQVQAHARHKKLDTTMQYIHQRDRLRDSAADYIDLSTDDE